MKKRDLWDNANLGHYHRCFPNVNPVSLVFKSILTLVLTDAPTQIWSNAWRVKNNLERVYWGS